MKQLLSFSAKFISKISKTFNLGHGSTWPGHIALQLNPHIINDILKESNTEVILVIGTNGKTTTGKILTTILKENGKKIIQNTSGANLLNGIASTLLLNTDFSGRLHCDYAVFEVDENNVPLVLGHITPKVIIVLDLFRDQLDRYGELDSIAKKWNASFQKLDKTTTLILNADDPLIANIGLSLISLSSLGEGQGESRSKYPKVVYFGLPEAEKGQKKLEHAADSIYCPNCGKKLEYKKIFYSHLGIWHCPSCGIKRPLPSLQSSIYPLPGMYNKYNTLAAVLASLELGISPKGIDTALGKVTPAFGRQEKLTIDGKNVQIFLAKNPISMNESLKTILNLSSESSLSSLGEGQGEGGSKKAYRTIKPSILFILNDRIPDGLDVSWIWDIDIEQYVDKFSSITVSGDRCYDMALRLQYAQTQIAKRKSQNTNYKLLATSYIVEPDLNIAIKHALESVRGGETLYILPTYSAMLEVRKILTGKRIL